MVVQVVLVVGLLQVLVAMVVVVVAAAEVVDVVVAVVAEVEEDVEAVVVEDVETRNFAPCHFLESLNASVYSTYYCNLVLSGPGSDYVSYQSILYHDNLLLHLRQIRNGFVLVRHSVTTRDTET